MTRKFSEEPTPCTFKFLKGTKCHACNHIFNIGEDCTVDILGTMYCNDCREEMNFIERFHSKIEKDCRIIEADGNISIKEGIFMYETSKVKLKKGTKCKHCAWEFEKDLIDNHIDGVIDYKGNVFCDQGCLANYLVNAYMKGKFTIEEIVDYDNQL